MEGPQAVRAPGPAHVALIYREPAEFVAAAELFIADAGPVALIAARAENLELLRSQLDGRPGQPTLAGTATNPARQLGVIRQFTAAHPGEPARCVQELGWLSRRSDEMSEALRQDALLTDALRDSTARVLCAYDGRLDEPVLAAAEQLHPMVLRDGRWRPGSGDDGASALADPPLAPPPASAVALPYADDLGSVRDFAARQAAAAGLAARRVTDLVIAVSELAANTLAHTAGPGMLTVWVAAGEIICQVTDSGRIRDPLAGTLCPDPTSPRRGRGLWVVHQVCDLVQIRTGPAGTAIRLHMRL